MSLASSPYTEDLRLAHMIADSVDAQTMAHFTRMDFEVETKPDLTPVTVADRQAEELIRSQLSRARGRDAVYGEEFGESGSGPRRWIIDPIDGTKNFIRGVPVWATLIALVDHGEPVVGLVSAPALGRRWWAAKDGGAYTGKSLSAAKQLSVSKVSRLEDAYFSYSSLYGWEEIGRSAQFVQFTETVWRTRAFGDFWSYCLVAEGTVDVAAEPALNLHDMAALVPIVTEAGGQFTSLDNDPGCTGSNGLATNGLLHHAALKALAPHLDAPTLDFG
ncbi:histidinol-phosphatase [Nesterenkonia alkaliphila]|uniref:Histidinol-phosphatase n=1 Tax=Nesterenkonia alkaliphila TaxID=1463631 RepID=A0A7K1UIE4_9MICC|nr:histidinol-phosphatase [Nesterenkonia alkaliphila]MVT26154.1 histidinol-phosphatase [Nesterenkonia alkaliphila]GFZ84152.1 histidinol-phosphatase [Nesterenkonia alkaliphila]